MVKAYLRPVLFFEVQLFLSGFFRIWKRKYNTLDVVKIHRNFVVTNSDLKAYGYIEEKIQYRLGFYKNTFWQVNLQTKFWL